MTTTTHTQQQASPAWYATIIGLAGSVAVTADAVVYDFVAWWAWPLICLVGAALAFMCTVLQQNVREDQHWLRVYAYRTLTWVWLGVVATVTSATGWTGHLALWWAGGAAALAAVGHFCPTPPLVSRQTRPVEAPAGADRRHTLIREWEGHLRTVTKWKTVTVVGIQPWPNPADGFRLVVELPAVDGYTVSDLANYCDKLAAAARLRTGCVVQCLPSDTNGVAALDVMLRDNLRDSDNEVHTEPSTPASITDPFVIMSTPRGEDLAVSLRIETVTIGGATGSGKTTLLNRIIMFLARCTDTLIWVADYNGGGLANNWIEPWARGLATRPVVDWVATDENEFALMTAVAREISTSRKQNPEVRRRIRAANSGGVLPVGPDLPAIVLLADEGGSIRQKLTPLGMIAAEGLTQIAQLGRAMAVRTMMSVLRGTSDLMDKGFRSQSSIRLCLRMNEHGEYYHVLDGTPPKTVLKHKGSGYLKTMEFPEPVYGRTVNVDENAIEQHAIACGPLRPALDGHALNVAAKVRELDVTGGKNYDGWAGSQAQADVRAGRAYTGRWERAAALLAELRGEDFEEVARPEVSAEPAVQPGSAIDTFLKATTPPPAVADEGGNARIYQFPGVRIPVQAEPVQQSSARSRILVLVTESGPDGIAASELERSVDAAKSRVYGLLKEMLDAGQIEKNETGRYVTPRLGVEARQN